jgi:hypothetical protein
MGYPKHPWFGICPKRTDLGGSNLLMPIYHSGGRGRGTTVTQAIANQTQARVARFVLDRARMYSVATVARETLKASVGDTHAWLEAETALMDERVYELTRDISASMYRDGAGSKGTISAVDLNNPAAGTDRLTLTNVEDVTNFEVGQFLGFSATATGAIRDDDYFEVSAIDRSNGYLFVLGNTETGSAVAAGDHAIEQGDALDGGSTYLKMRGLDAWCPATAPTSGDSFFTVDRSVETTRLAGHRYDGSDQPVLEAIIDAGTLAKRENASPEIVLVNPTRMSEASKSLGGQAEYDIVKSSDGVYGYDAIKVRTGAGTVRLVSDPDCPVNTGYMLRRDACVLWSLGDTMELVDEDGQVLLRAASADSFEVRFAHYGQFVVKKPHEIVRIAFA